VHSGGEVAKLYYTFPIQDAASVEANIRFDVNLFYSTEESDYNFAINRFGLGPLFGYEFRTCGVALNTKENWQAIEAATSKYLEEYNKTGEWGDYSIPPNDVYILFTDFESITDLSEYGEQRSIKELTSAPSSWAAEAVKTADSLGLSTNELSAGYQDTTTRAEFCRAAVNFLRKYGYDVDSVTPKLFADTTDKDIGIAAALGITSGTDTAKNLFSPDNTLTREQAATMLRNVMNVIGAKYDTTAVNWTDAKDISSWAKEASDIMYSAKIMGGTSTTALVFSPKTPYTHEQSIITLVNLWNYVKK
jgi:hypothetical protein